VEVEVEEAEVTVVVEDKAKTDKTKKLRHDNLS